MSLTSCLKKAGADLRTEDRNAVLEMSRVYRTEGKTPIAAAIQAVEDQIKAVQALIETAQNPAPVLVAPTRADVLKQQADAEAEAKRKEDGGDKPLPRRELTGDVPDMFNPQGSVFDQPAEPAAPSNPDMLRAQADLNNALADLGDIFGKNTRLMMMPEQEAKILPVLVKLFDAAFRMGYYKFKDAAKFALDMIRAKLGEEIANDLTLDHLQGAYISLGKREGGDSKRTVIDIEDKAEIENHVAKADNSGQEKPNVPSPNVGVEPNSGKPSTGPAVVPSVPNVAGGTAPRAGNAGGQAIGENGGGRQDGAGVSPGRSPSDRERGDQLVRGGNEQAGPAGSDARTDFGERSGDSGITGIPPDAIPASEVKGAATSGTDDARKRSEQRAASQLTVKAGDLQNVRDTLPYLLPPQQEDVHKAETIFAKPMGYGMLFTNGTGTGKTFSGLGVVKRFAMQGKDDTLIVVPDNKIASDWIKSGKALGLDITQLDDTTQAGKGIVLTTYANLGANDALAKRQWALIVPDEAHSLMQAADGVATSYLQNLRAITHHPDGTSQRFTMLNRPDIDRMAALNKQIVANNKIINGDDTMDVMRQSLQAENAKLEKQLAPLNTKLNAARDAVKAEVAAMQGAKRTRLVFLSATPFAYEKTVDWANGYLFDYMDGYPYDPQRAGLNYNQPDPFQHFVITRFGYSMRFNKLNAPGPKVDSGLLQRQFNGELKKKGVLSGRMLDVKPDYDRRFVLIDSAIGNKIDEALEWLTDKAQDESEAQAKIEDRSKREGGMAALRDTIKDQFDYLSRRYLLEAIKAESVIPIVKQHLALGRKVVVFHDYNKGGSTNPFDVRENPINASASEQDAAKAKSFNKAVREFRAKFPELATGLNDLLSPIEVFKKELPQTMLINGKEKEKDLLARYLSFQDDANGPQVMLVQSDKNKGWSGHDTTGKHQRVLINLGQPTAPTKAIQQEGRIYRTGQASNAIMRYLNTGTSWERWAFATTIAQRSSTAENLGMGEQARALKDSFIAAFEESDAYAPGHEGEGTGGKERDKASNDAITEYDRAKSFYWGTQKKNSKTKAQEGADYFATPEPVGLKMVEWLDARNGEDLLEPSGGHGAIARWMPEKTQKTVIEPSANLRSRMALVLDMESTKMLDGTFEELNVVNKFDGIAMNPPFGSGGKTAIDHLAKAATHLRDGGRIVALIPTGPAADKKFDKWFYEASEKPAKPIFTLGSEKLYRGDTLHFKGFGRELSMVLGRVAVANGTHYAIPEGGDLSGGANLGVGGLNRIEPGPRAETYNPTADLMLIADIKLPQVTFERAGTAVATRIVVLEKHAKESEMPQRTAARMDFSGIDDINELFDRLENVTLPKRPKVDPVELEVAPAGEKVGQTVKADKPGKAPKAESTGTFPRNGAPIVEVTTSKGKVLRGIIRSDLTKVQALAVDPHTWIPYLKNGSKADGYFIRERYLAPDDFDAPMAARGTIAREPQAAYSGTYETDLFGEPLSTDLFGGVVKTDGVASAKPTGSKLRGDAQPSGTLQDTPATPGEYFVNTLIGTETNREIGAKRVATPFQAATATQYLYKSAVERFDGIVTDANHKPLAVIGGFKGAIAEASVYPGTLMAEAIRIPGAAHIWFSHNHPSGKSELSRADMALNRTLSDTFTGSGIRPMGLMAVGDGKFSFVSGTIDSYGQTDGGLSDQDIPQSTGSMKLPVIERTIGNGKPGASFSDPEGARRVGKAFYDKTKQPGIMLLNAQSQVTAWIPITDQMRKTLRGTGGLNAIYRAISQSNPAAAAIIHGGELHRKTLPEGTPSQLVTSSQNIAAALKNVGVQTLDSIDIVSGESVASIGGHVAKGPVYSRGASSGMTVDQARAITDPLTAKWNLDVKVVATPADLPIPAPSDVRGMYMSGKIWLVASNNASRKQILETLGHEAIAHHGLREMLGREDWRKFMANISLAIKSGNKPLNAISQRVRREYVDDNGKFNLSAIQEADEIAAKVVEGAIDPVTGEFNPGFGFMKSVFAKVAQFLRDLGIDVKFTNIELQGMLVSSMRNMESGARMQGGGAQVVASYSLAKPAGSATVKRIGDMWAAVTNEGTGNENHIGYYSSESEAKSAATAHDAKLRLEINTRSGKFAGWWTLDSGNTDIRPESIRGNDAVATGRAIRQTLDSRVRAVSSTAEGRNLKQIPSREGFCFKCAAEAAMNDIGDFVIGESHDRKSPVWHAVVMRDGMVYDPTFGKWFAPGIYTKLGFKEALRLTPEQVRDYLKATQGRFPDAKNQGLGDSPAMQGKRGVFARTGDLLTSYTPEEAKKKQLEEEAARKAEDEKPKAPTGRKVTADQVDLFNPQESLFARGGGQTQKASVIFGREIAPLAMNAYKSLSVTAKNAVDNWNVNWSTGPLVKAFAENNEIASEIRVAFQPVKDKLREIYGDTIPLYRGEYTRDENPSKESRTLFSWSPIPELAKQYAINRKGGLPKPITDEQIDAAVAQYERTGFVKFRGESFARMKDTPEYYNIYDRDRGHITDGDDLRESLKSDQQDREEWIAELRTNGKAYSANVPIDKLAWIPVGANLSQPEIIAEYNPRLHEADDVPMFARGGGQTETPAFKKWFGDSKVVDADGKPLVVYHGTTADITIFDPTKGQQAEGIFMTADKSYANGFGNGRSGGGKVMPLYVSMKNPRYISLENWNVDSLNAAMTDHKSDGVIVKNDDGSVYVVVAQTPTQIKSATGNNGDFDGTNPDIRFARGPVNIWTAPPAGDSLIYEIQDQRVDLKRIQQAIEKSGQQIEEKWDARLAETIYPGRVAHRSQKFLENEAKPMLEAMAKAKISMDEMADYLHARGAEERNVQIAKVNANMPDGGAGTNTQGTLMTTANANAYLAGINPARKAQLDVVAARVDAITKGTRRLLVAEGLEKQSAINNWEAVYKNYVPMFKDEAESAMPPHPQGTGFTAKGKASKRAMGSTKEVTNMLAHVLMQREAAITRAEKNRVALSLYGMALSHPNPDFWTTIKPGMSHGAVVNELQSMGVDVATAFVGMKAVPTIRVVDPVTNQVVDRANPVYKNLPGAITFKLNGEDRVIMLNVKHERGLRLATSLKNLDGLTTLDIAGSIVGKSTRWLAAVNTQYNPAFGLVNLTRDVLGGVINLGSTELKGNALRVLASTPVAIWGIARELSSKNQTGKWQSLYRQFKADGAQTGWRENFRDPNERAKAIEKELADLKRAGKLSPGRFAHAMLDLLDGFNTTLENAVRLSAYSKALDKGISRPEAARLARELTVDFNRKGRMGREVGPLYAFFNASVQGSARTIETLKGPTGKAVIAGGLSLGILQALMLLAAGYDDDELKEFEKTRTLIIPTNWTGEGKKTHIMIPYPLGLHVLPNTGRVMAELSLNGGKDIGKRSMEAIGEIAGAFNPLGGGNIFTADGALKTIAPTLIDPVIEIGFNRNFAGNPIERQAYGSESDNRPGFVRTKEATQRSTTGQVYMSISKAVNSLTGGTDYEAGTLSPTPERIRYIAQTAGGGVLREIEKTINATTATMRGEKTTRSQIPVLGRFAGEVDDDQVQTSRYFETSKKLHRLDSSLKAMTKAGDSEAMGSLIDKNPEVLMVKQFNKTQQIIAKLNKEAVQTIGDVKEMESIDQDRISLMRDLNDAMKDMEKDSGRVTLADRVKPVLRPRMAEAVP